MGLTNDERNSLVELRLDYPNKMWNQCNSQPMTF